MPTQSNAARRRPPPSPNTAIPPGTKQINAALLLDNARPGFDRDDHLASSRLVVWGAMIYGAAPALVSWVWMLSLIFGGCCSNVCKTLFAIEISLLMDPMAGLRTRSYCEVSFRHALCVLTVTNSGLPEKSRKVVGDFARIGLVESNLLINFFKGMLITFAQFLLTAFLTWPAHFSASHPPFFLKPRAIPIRRWLPSIILFFSTNALNNYAFGFDISVPVHIILRSGGSVTTMIVGFLWGKRYTRTQVFSVVLLTIGVIGAALADAGAKVLVVDAAVANPQY